MNASTGSADTAGSSVEGRRAAGAAWPWARTGVGGEKLKGAVKMVKQNQKTPVPRVGHRPHFYLVLTLTHTEANHTVLSRD